MGGVEAESIAAAEPRGGAARGEEYLVCSLTDGVAVEAVDASEGPLELPYGSSGGGRGWVVRVQGEVIRIRRTGGGIRAGE